MTLQQIAASSCIVSAPFVESVISPETRRKWQTTPTLLPGESHRQRSLAGHSPWGCKESEMTEDIGKYTVLGIKLWALVELVAIGMIMFLGPLSRQNGEIYVILYCYYHSGEAKRFVCKLFCAFCYYP